jgi:hypothetical protein
MLTPSNPIGIPDWLCKCGHKRMDHIIMDVDPTPHDTFFGCQVKKKDGYWKDKCSEFRPVDNLTLVEKLAKQRGL